MFTMLDYYSADLKFKFYDFYMWLSLDVSIPRLLISRFKFLQSKNIKNDNDDFQETEFFKKIFWF